MNNLNFKWLAAALLLCAPVFAFADEETNTTTVEKSYELYIDEYPWNYTAAVSGSISVNFTDQWGEFRLSSLTNSDGGINTSDYTGYKVVVDDVSSADGVQITIQYAGIKSKGTNEDGTEKIEYYTECEDITAAGTYEGTFKTGEADGEDKTYGNVTGFEVQGKTAGASVTISAVYLTKGESEEEELQVYGGTNWGCTYVAHDLPAITYTGRYGGVYITDAETGEPITYTYGSGEETVITVTLAEALTGALVVELDDENKSGFAWQNIEAGANEFTITLNDEACTVNNDDGNSTTHDVAYVYIKANKDNDATDSEGNGYYAEPYTVKFKSITAKITTVNDVGEEGEDEGDESGEDTGGDNLNLSTGDAELTTAGTYVITGDGTTDGQHNTIKFPESPSGTYNITLKNVKIDTRTSDADVAPTKTPGYSAGYNDPAEDEDTYSLSGLYIPEGDDFTVNLTIEGDNEITGEKYGIFVADDDDSDKKVTLNISPTGSETYDPDGSKLEINGQYGIYNLGQGITYRVSNNGGSSSTVMWGTTTINAEYCGIYSPKGLDLDDTYMNITVTGDGDVEVEQNPTSSTTSPGYTVKDLVCGIYVDGTQSTMASNALNIAMVELTIVAAGEHTYGLFVDGAPSGYTQQSAYFGYGIIDITATECVIHHEGQYNGYSKSEAYLTIIARGPYCGHYYGTWNEGSGDMAHYWYCDGSISDMASSGNMRLILVDLVNYPYDSAGEFSVSEVEYVDRILYTGWNTVCLPYDYNLDPSDTDDSDTYGSDIEARTVISKFALFDSVEKKEDNGSVVYEFTPTEVQSGEEQKLTANTAYLVYVPSDNENVTTLDTQGNTGAVTMFTMMNAKMVVVQDDYDGGDGVGDALKTVFHEEGIYPEGDTEHEGAGTHYKLIREEKDDEVTNYFNLPSEDMTVGAYRAYLDGNSIGAAGVSSIKIQAAAFSGEEETTGIQAIDADGVCTGNVDVYNMNGQLVKTAHAGESVSNGLAKGVYIVGGKKIAVM